MPFLPSIIKRIDEFFKIAERYSLVSLGADDQVLHAELVKATKEVLNPELSYNLVALAAMYQKALEINGGFNTIYKAIQGMVEDMDPDEEETEPVENLLNQIASSIKTRAQRPDSPGDMRELQTAASNARTEDSPFNYDEPEDSDEESAYEAMLGFGGAEKAFEEAGGVSQFDMTGGVNPEAAQSGTGRGYSVGKPRTYKEWAHVYSEELKKYSSLLNDPTNMLSPSARVAREDTRVKSNINELETVLKKLIPLTTEAVRLQNKIEVETEVDHEATGTKGEQREILKEMGVLEQKRRQLKRNLSTLYKKIELENLQSQVASTQNPREKLILEEKIALQDLRTRGAYGYGKEAKERTRLIAALTADPNLSEEEIKKMREKIKGAAQFTDKMTKAEYDRKVTLQRGNQQKREETPTYEPTRGGGRVPMAKLPKEQQIDLENASFSALVYQFQIDIASATQAARQAIYEIKTAGKGKGGVKKQLNTAYKQIIDEMSDAIRKKDRAALEATKQKLVQSVSQDLAVQKHELKGYLDVIRLEPHFRKILDDIKDATRNPSKKELKDNPNAPSKLDADGNIIAANYSEADIALFRMILNDMYRLRSLYDKYYINIASLDRSKHVVTNDEWWKIKKQISARFKNVIDDMKKIEVRLLLDLKVQRPETKMRIQERSQALKDIWQNLEKTDPKRFEKEKAKWLEDALKTKSSAQRTALLKIAQEQVQPEIDQATADRLANELADSIFDQLYQSMLSELQA